MHEGHDTAREVMMFTLLYHLTSEVPHFHNCFQVETNYNIEIDAVKVNFFFFKEDSYGQIFKYKIFSRAPWLLDKSSSSYNASLYEVWVYNKGNNLLCLMFSVKNGGGRDRWHEGYYLIFPGLNQAWKWWQEGYGRWVEALWGGDRTIVRFLGFCYKTQGGQQHH